LVNEAFAPLRRRGVRIAVDDTGAGFASLRHVLDLRPDIIKLDIGLVRGIDRDEHRAGVARMLLEFSRGIDARVIAEGVETPAERDTLLRLGASLGQGYLFGRPEHLAAPGVSSD
jgi:EAL domain-containing protein (putative c-di-GMP-specific phosphodiesterase class I)